MDALEQQFYKTGGSSVSLYPYPEDVGGIYLFADGPFSTVGNYLGSVVVTWLITFRGSRNAATGYLAPVPLPLRDESTLRIDKREPLNSSSENPIHMVTTSVTPEPYVILGGKAYIRVGEATNPGPDSVDGELPL
jgi:hypothetical protein